MNIEVLEQLLEEYKKSPESKQSVIDVCNHTLDFIRISLQDREISVQIMPSSEGETENLDNIRNIDNEFESNIDLTPITTPEERSKIPIREVLLEYGNGQTEVFHIPDDPRYFEKSLLAIFDTARELVMIDSLSIMLNSTPEKTLEDFSKVIPEDFQNADISISKAEAKRIREYNDKSIDKDFDNLTIDERIERAGFQNFIMAIVCRLSLNEAFRLNIEIQTRIRITDDTVTITKRYVEKDQLSISFDKISRTLCKTKTNENISTVFNGFKIKCFKNPFVKDNEPVMTVKHSSILNMIYSHYDYLRHTTGTMYGNFNVSDIFKKRITSEAFIEEFHSIVTSLFNTSIVYEDKNGIEHEEHILNIVLSGQDKKARMPYSYMTTGCPALYWLTRQTREFSNIDHKLLFSSKSGKRERFTLDYVSLKYYLIQKYALTQHYKDTNSEYENSKLDIDYTSDNKVQRKRERELMAEVLEDIKADASELNLSDPDYKFYKPKQSSNSIGIEFIVNETPEQEENKTQSDESQKKTKKTTSKENNQPIDPKRKYLSGLGSISKF